MWACLWLSPTISSKDKNYSHLRYIDLLFEANPWRCNSVRWFLFLFLFFSAVFCNFCFSSLLLRCGLVFSIWTLGFHAFLYFVAGMDCLLCPRTIFWCQQSMELARWLKPFMCWSSSSTRQRKRRVKSLASSLLCSPSLLAWPWCPFALFMATPGSYSVAVLLLSSLLSCMAPHCLSW